MNCDDVRGLLDAWVDGELSAADRGAVGRHVEGCETCARDVARIRALGRRLRALGRHPLPDGLEARIASVVDGATQRRRLSVLRPGWLSRAPVAAVLASHAIAVLVGALAVVAWLWLRPGAPPAGSEREVVSAHVRGLVQEQFRTVESGNPHAVRPWFSGKVGFAPRVIDLAEAGFPLQAGRVDHLLGQPAAALVYARRSHRITLFVAPRSSMSRDVRVGGGDGYHLVGWGDAEFDYWAVSDLNRAELATFATMLRAAIDRTGAK
jgi:anti-sigma factor RsiW